MTTRRGLLLGLLAGALPALVWAQSTAFTYQGRLLDGGNPANGSYQLQFKLFDALPPGSGNQIGATLTDVPADVSAGLFTVALDFGPAMFDGGPRYLEIGVRPDGSANPYTTLTRRQPITSSPYAVRSSGAARADDADALGGVPAANYVVTTDARLSDARPPTPGSANYIQNGNSTQAGSNFAISGNGVALGTLAGAIVNATQRYQLNGATVLSNPGTNNLFAGVGAGAANGTGASDSFFGSSAGGSNTTGFWNSFFGTTAGNSNSVGNENSFFGYAAGFATTTGGFNSFFGAESGMANVTGGANAFFGARAGKANTTACCNSYFGSQAGLNATGDSNSFFGNQAGQGDTTGSVNSFFGDLAGFSNTTGGSNSFFGVSAGLLNTAGNNNAFFGVDAGRSNTADSNTFFGRSAGFANTTGSGNVFVGLNAGRFNVSGNTNSFLGQAAGYNTTTGVNNTFMGASAGLSNTTGINNSFFGVEAGRGNTGDNNAFFGRSAGYDNTTGSGGVFVGLDAGRFNTTGSANSFVGQGAGYNNTTGGSNTFIGWGAGNPNSGTQVNNSTALGAGASVTASNTIVLGTSSEFTRIPGSLQVSGTLDAYTLASGGQVSLCVTASFRLAYCSSSLRYKTDVATWSPGLDLVQRLHPISFTWRENGRKDLGLGAEDVEQVEPLLVSHNAQGELEGVKYDRVAMVLLNAVQEQQAQIASQRERIERQQAQLDQLRETLAALEHNLVPKPPTP